MATTTYVPGVLLLCLYHSNELPGILVRACGNAVILPVIRACRRHFTSLCARISTRCCDHDDVRY